MKTKKALPLFLSLLFFITTFSSKAQTSFTPELIVKSTLNLYAYSELEDAILSIGLGAEAKISRRFSLGSDVTFGRNERLKFLFVNPNVRFYFNRTFQGMFLKAGLVYVQAKSIDGISPVGYPFYNDDSSRASELGPEIGVGYRAFIKEHWTVAFSLNLNSNFDSGFSSNISVGYAF